MKNDCWRYFLEQDAHLELTVTDDLSVTYTDFLRILFFLDYAVVSGSINLSLTKSLLPRLRGLVLDFTTHYHILIYDGNWIYDQNGLYFLQGHEVIRALIIK